MTFKKENTASYLVERAFEETLELLEWQQVCEQLASFASTSSGRRICRNGSIPKKFEVSYAAPLGGTNPSK